MRVEQDGTSKAHGRLLRSFSQSQAGVPGRVGRHGGMRHCIAGALGTVMVASLPGPWSDREASPALQRDTSNMEVGPAQQPLQDFKLRTLLRGRATVLPFWFSQPSFFTYSFSLLLSSLGGGGRVTLSLSLIDTKQNSMCMGHRGHIYRGEGRPCSQSWVVRAGATPPPVPASSLAISQRRGLESSESHQSHSRAGAPPPHHSGLSSGGACLGVGFCVSNRKGTGHFLSACNGPITAPRAVRR